jgi:hypothetical protein
MHARSTSPGGDRGGEQVRLERWTSPSGTRRLLVHLEDDTAVVYARAARLAVPRPISGPRALGSARRPDRPPSFPRERRAWRTALLAALATASYVETGDVASCYASIHERAIRAAAAAAGGDPEPVLRFLARTRSLGVPGLPIGPLASSYLADAVLAVADAEAARVGAPPVRWVDDVVFAGDRGAVERSARAWRRALVELGLAPHVGKRRCGAPARVEAGSGCSVPTRRRGIIRP